MTIQKDETDEVLLVHWCSKLPSSGKKVSRRAQASRRRQACWVQPPSPLVHLRFPCFLHLGKPTIAVVRGSPLHVATCDLPPCVLRGTFMSRLHQRCPIASFPFAQPSGCPCPVFEHAEEHWPLTFKKFQS